MFEITTRVPYAVSSQPWGAFIQGLVTLASSPSSLWSKLLPVVELVWLSGLGGS